MKPTIDEQIEPVRMAEGAEYELGKKAVWLNLLRQALANLGSDEKALASWTIERAETVAMLRSICAEHGDNDWSDSLHLADVIDKHLGRHLPSPAK